MDLDRLSRFLDSFADAETELRSWGLVDLRRAHAALVRMATKGITLDLMATICDTLADQLPRSSDPDMALNNLDRFMAAARSPLSLAALFERDHEALPVLLQIFSTSQHLSDLLTVDEESYDLLRLTEGQPVQRDILVDELVAETETLSDEQLIMAALRRCKRRELLRISYGDMIRSQRLEIVTAQLSYLADAIVHAAYRFCRRRLEAVRGCPRCPDGTPARFVVLGMGKLGGCELNYSSDIDLIFLHESDGKTDGDRPLTNVEFFDRMARDMVKLLTEATELGAPYRVDLRLRPEGERGPMVHSIDQALHYYDVLGRTWERQAYVKARAIAGDIELGAQFLAKLEPWIYRRYLSRADISGIRALKRRIEQRAQREGEDAHNVKTGRGGIRDVEFVIQFLQLLNAPDRPSLRTGNTKEAIALLERDGCLIPQERSYLEEGYDFLRKVEHRLQIMFDLQCHLIPDSQVEMRKLAIRLGYADSPQRSALEAFETDHARHTARNRQILDHLLHDAFMEDGEQAPEVDLVLDPDPTPERIQEVLGRYPFRDVPGAYRNLMALAKERSRFLSTRRCRHFLASIAPRLLQAIAATPDADSTLVNLEKVSDSLGGKGGLWELFSFNPPSMTLYVEICSASPFLSGLLVSNPGMIDELMDSLVRNQLPTLTELQETLFELTRAAEDLDPIFQSFKNTQLLRVGVRDILGKDDIQETIAALTDIAQACLARIAEIELAKLVEKFGQPSIVSEDQQAKPCGFVILGLGKLGGSELNYHSDLDVVFLYEGEGNTIHPARSRRGETTTNQHFFSELGQRIIRVATRLGPSGRLYEVDARLRPTGRSGALATSFAEFSRYFEEGMGQLWERQALCKARVVFDTFQLKQAAQALIVGMIHSRPWEPTHAEEIRQMRRRMEESVTALDIKRAPGGIVDVEFLVQLLQLKFGSRYPQIREPNTLRALAALRASKILTAAEGDALSASYRLLRTIEARLRLMSTTSRNDLPESPLELEKLARNLDRPSATALLNEVRELMQDNRRRFISRTNQEAAAAVQG